MLYSFVLTGPGIADLDNDFVRFASVLQQKYSGIRAVAVAPGGVFKYVYPAEGNEEMLGYDLLNDSDPAIMLQNERIFRGKPTILRGPVSLLQGEEGIILTKGIFLNGTYEDGDFWGFVSIIIDMPEMYRQSGISDTSGEFLVALKNDDYGIFYGNQTVFDSDPNIYDMKIGNEIWTFAIVPKDGWCSLVCEQLNYFKTISFIFVLILGLFGGYVAYSHLRLNVAVIERTKDLKKMQKDLLFRDMAIDSSVSPVIISNKKGRIVYMNGAALKLWNIEGEAARRKNMSDLFIDTEIISEFLDKKEENMSWTGDLKGKKADDSDFIAHGSVSAVTDKSGNFHGVHGSFVDITAGLKAEEALSENEYKYHEIFDNVNEIIVVNRLFNDPDVAKRCSIVEINNMACEKLGYTKEELLSMKLYDIISDNSLEDFQRSAEQLLRTGTVVVEISFVGKDGTEFPVLSNTRLLTIGGNKFALSLIQDLTLEKEARKREMETLKHIEENLVRLAALNDEIRNPLAVIVGYASLDGGENAEKILNQAGIIDQLINRLDKRWLESEKIREYLRKYYDIENTGSNGDENNRKK